MYPQFGDLYTLTCTIDDINSNQDYQTNRPSNIESPSDISGSNPKVLKGPYYISCLKFSNTYTITTRPK